jgi:hypothetical protein
VRLHPDLCSGARAQGLGDLRRRRFACIGGLPYSTPPGHATLVEPAVFDLRKVRELRSNALVAALIAALFCCVGPVSAADISATAVHGPMPGTCPGTITFTATITAEHWSPTARREVQYTWIRDDGGNAPTHTLRFPRGSWTTRTVSTTWTLGAPHDGWEAIQITYPQSMTSNHANFRFWCRSRR